MGPISLRSNPSIRPSFNLARNELQAMRDHLRAGHSPPPGFANDACRTLEAIATLREAPEDVPALLARLRAKPERAWSIEDIDAVIKIHDDVLA